MMPLRRPFQMLLLILTLAAGSVSMVVARGHAAAAAGGSTIVICSGYGVMTVTLDAAGNPTGPVMPCPDCLAGLAFAILPEGPALMRFTASGSTFAGATGTAQTRPAPLSLPPARGPPRPV